MKKWHQILAGSIAGILAILFVLPTLLGRLISNHYSEFLHQLNPPANPSLNFQLQSYHRHWFSSDAIIAISLSNPTGQQTIEMTQHIKHGPFMFGTDWQGHFHFYTGLAWAQSESIHPLFKTQFDLLIKTLHTMMIQGTIYHIQWPILFTTLDCHQLTGYIHLSFSNKRFSQAQGHVEAKQIEQLPSPRRADANRWHWNMNQLICNFQLQNTETGWIGPYAIHFAEFDLTRPNNKRISLKNGNITREAHTKDDKYDLSSQWNIKSAQVDGTTLSPVQFSINLSGVSIKALANWREAAQNLNFLETHFFGLKAFHWGLVLPTIQLLNQGFSLVISQIHIGTTSGPISGQISWVIPEPIHNSSFFRVPKYSDVKANLSIPEPLLEMGVGLLGNYLHQQEWFFNMPHRSNLSPTQWIQSYIPTTRDQQTTVFLEYHDWQWFLNHKPVNWSDVARITATSTKPTTPIVTTPSP